MYFMKNPELMQKKAYSSSALNYFFVICAILLKIVVNSR